MKVALGWATVASAGTALAVASCSANATCKDGHAVFEGGIEREAEFSTGNKSLLTSTGNGGSVWRYFQDQGRMRLDYGSVDEPSQRRADPVKFTAPIVGGELFLPPDGPKRITGGNVEVDERGPDRATFDLEGSGSVNACF